MKKHWNFIVRAVNLLLILAVLWQYQQVALVRADAVTARQKEIDEANAWNTSVLQAQQAAEEAEAEFLTDAYFDAWYDQTLAALSAFAG